MNDRNDDQFEQGGTPEFDESGELDKSQDESLEDFTDKMEIADGNSLTFGEYKKIRNDPEHPIRDPEHPHHGDYLEAVEIMGSMGEKLKGINQSLGQKFDLSEALSKQTKSRIDASFQGLNEHLKVQNPLQKIQEDLAARMKPQLPDLNAGTTNGFQGNSPLVGDMNRITGITNEWRKQHEAFLEETQKIARLREEERELEKKEAREFREEISLTAVNMLRIQNQMAETNAKNREADKKEQAERDRIEEERSNRNFNLGVATLITAVVTFFATLLGLFIR